VNLGRTYYAPDRAHWRAWLEKHHATETEVWLIYYKRETGKPRVSYNDAVEEALCFGWIDSILRRIDDKRYAQRFTPRRPDSQWSALNKQRVEKLIAEGRMTEAGLSKIRYTTAADDYGRTPAKKKKLLIPPADFKRALAAKSAAAAFFRSLAPSYRRNYIAWITNAKTPQTRHKRIAEAVRLLASKKKLGLK